MRISDWSSGVCSSDLAVVGRLPGERAAVAEAGEHGVWELLVGELGFLQADHVRLRVAKPLFQVRQAHVEGVDVPAGDFHAWFPWKSRRGRSPGLRDPISPRRSGRSEAHKSDLQSLMRISYDDFRVKRQIEHPNDHL